MQDLRVSHSSHRPANDAPARRFLPPYHVFKHSGECFAYFLERDCAFHIDRPTYDLLARALKGSFAEAADRLLQEGKYDTDTVASIMSEVSRLQQAGFFRPVRNRLSTAEKEQALTHRYTTPWTRLELALAESCNSDKDYDFCNRNCAGRADVAWST